MKELTKLLLILLSISFMLIVSCQDNQILNEPKEDDSALVVSVQTRAVNPYDFDWENADWMPTPPGQSQIPSPWVGQGSLASTYGLDVLNDRKAFDGWELMYNSFDPNAPGQLINPYFVLYNKYRGLLRIFLYTTTQFYESSSNLQDGISIISSDNTSLLNFVGKETINVRTTPTKSYSQIHPKPADGTPPLASNKWYMMQYELAYDPNLATIPYNQIQLNWSLSSYNVTEVNLGGGITGTINGTIGSASSTSSNIISELKDTGEGVGEGVLAGVGLTYITNNTINSETGENKLKIPNHIFKALSTGVSSALSAVVGDIPGAVISILSGIFGGSSSGPTAASFNLNADISLKGTLTNAGSFPSTPISFWVPGTNIAPDAVGYIPLYNRSLGVFNVESNLPRVNPTISSSGPYSAEDPWNGEKLEYYQYRMFSPQPRDYSWYLQINPVVLDSATVEIKKQEYYIKYYMEGESSKNLTLAFEPFSFYWERWYPHPEQSSNPPLKEPIVVEQGLRFTIEVIPNNGAPSSLIYKSFAM
jgi:hypothetical protein